MKPSPIQLLQVLLQHVRVELDPQHLPQELPNPLTSAFVFDGVGIQTEISVGETASDHGRGRIYLASLRVVVDNAPKLELKSQKFSPYRIDVAVDGVILLPKGAEALGKPEDLASVNGAAMLWSVVREQVSNLTSRMRAGPVMLPTVHFHDLKGAGMRAATSPAAPPVKVPSKSLRAPAKAAPRSKRG